MDSQVQRIYHQVEAELDTFENQLNKLEVPNYPTDTSKKIIASLKEKAVAYRATARKIIQELDDGGAEEARAKLITMVHLPLVQQDSQFLDWLQDSQTGSVPWSLIPCIEKLASVFLPNQEVLVYCANKFNYQICWSADPSIAPYQYIVVALPKLYRVNVLQHALIGHELFHPRCRDFVGKHNHAVLEKITRKVTDEFEKSPAGNSPDDLFSETEKKKTIVNTSSIIHLAWRRATEELLCDMACVHVFGPAGILAMRSFFSCSPLNEMPDPKNNFYPSCQYRFEVAWEHFVDEEKVEALRAKLPAEIAICFEKDMNEIATLVSKKSGKVSVKEHPCAKIAYEEVGKLLPAAAKFVREVLIESSEKWNSSKAMEQIPELVDRLQKGIPPNEVMVEVSELGELKYETHAAEFTSIMLAGWIYETYWQKNYTDSGTVMKFNTLLRLVLKAFEDNESIGQA
ncbi:hypothetical protein KAR91_64930 [Candidatus Pacearchaeota archaeon]|nr:hypothetical protein [Candidatus Pacearchaeota archaeon]